MDKNYLIFIGGEVYQEEFTALFERLKTFATQRAAGYFKGGDGILRDKAAEDAMDAVTEVWRTRPVEPKSYDEEEAKKIIHNSIRNASLTKKVQPINLEGDEFNNMHGYKLV